MALMGKDLVTKQQGQIVPTPGLRDKLSRAAPQCELFSLPWLASLAIAVVFSGRASLCCLWLGCFPAISHSRIIRWIDYHAGGGSYLFGIHDAPDLGPARTAKQSGGPQPERLAAVAAHPERLELVGAGHARHAG